MKKTKKKTRPEKDLTNLYEEICEYCKPTDIDYVVITVNRWHDNERYVLIPTEWFLEQAKRIDYDAGFGGEVIDTGLKIVLKDGRWLERDTYDGSEGFSLKGKPQKPEEEAKRDIAVILHDKHGCPYNETTIDGQSINKQGRWLDRDSYSMWFEKKGKLVTEDFQWQNGNYRKEHEPLMK